MKIEDSIPRKNRYVAFFYETTSQFETACEDDVVDIQQLNKWSKNFDERPHRRGIFLRHGKIYCDTRLLLRPAKRNAGRQHAGKS